MAYITRERAVIDGEKGVSLIQLPEHVRAAKGYDELRQTLIGYAEREEIDVAQHRSRGEPRTHYRVTVSFERDVPTEKALGMADEYFIRAARLRPDRVFALGGEGWGDKAMPSNVVYLGHVPTASHKEVNGAARIVLNIHRQSMVENGWSPATRVLEAAGAAACQITDEWMGIEDFFDPGTEILVASDAAEACRLAQERTAGRARAIGEAARARALRDHTGDQRAIQFDQILRTHPGSPA